PLLVVQGERDPFGMPPQGPSRDVVKVPGNHGLKADLDAVAAAVREWLPGVAGAAVPPQRRERWGGAPQPPPPPAAAPAGGPPPPVSVLRGLPARGARRAGSSAGRARQRARRAQPRWHRAV